jgi:predicted metal-dependent enzyme (double-stranded beta helix superfamily)
VHERPAGAVRHCAVQLLEILDDVGDDLLRREKDIVAVMEDLLALPGLDTVVANPTWTATESGPTVGWLYQDTDLRIVRGTIPAGFVQAPHNHGSWNVFGVYRGAVHSRSFRRLDDGSRPYHAELDVAEDRVMTDGDVTVLPAPPHDVHTVAGLAPLTITLLVARGPFAAMRERYLPDRDAFFLASGEDAAR